MVHVGEEEIEVVAKAIGRAGATALAPALKLHPRLPGGGAGGAEDGRRWISTSGKGARGRAQTAREEEMARRRAGAEPEIYFFSLLRGAIILIYIKF